MAIKLIGDSGLVLVGGDGSEFDIMAHREKIKSAVEHAIHTFEYHIPTLDINGVEIKSINEALAALIAGTLKANPFANGRTLISHYDHGVAVTYLWNSETQELNKLGVPVGNHYLSLNGTNFIEFDGNGELFDFNKSWFVSLQFLIMHANNAFQSVFSLGDNSYNFLTGGTNYGIYLDDREPVTQGGSARSNTWHDPEMLRMMLNYNHVTQRLEYWTGTQGGTATRIKDLDVNQYQGDPSQLYENQPASAKLYIGKGLSGAGNLLGDINDFIAGTSFLEQATIQNMFNATRDDLVEMSEVEYHAPIGEDTGPLISCSGGLTGTVINYQEGDFKPVDPE